MSTESTPLTGFDDHELAAELARRAGELLLEVREGPLEGSALGKEGDHRANELLIRTLGEVRPDDSILSEESVDDPARLGATRVWIVDPLDGTREFTEPGRQDWAVHVALYESGELAAGAVGLPARGIVLSTSESPVVPPRTSERPTIVLSRSRAPELLHLVAARVGADVRPLGSAGAKTAAVILGEADAYLHAGGQYEWDSAAPVAVARAAGLHTSRLYGGPLVYNQPNPYLPDLMVCRPELAAAFSDALAELGEPRP